MGPSYYANTSHKYSHPSIKHFHMHPMHPFVYPCALELKIQTSLTTHGRQRPRLLVAIWSLVWWGFPGFLNPGSGRLFIDFIVLSDLFSGEVFKKGGRDYMTLWWSNMARNPWIFPATPMVTAGMKTCHGADDTEGYLMAQWPNYHVFPSAMAINGEILTIV